MAYDMHLPAKDAASSLASCERDALRHHYSPVAARAPSVKDGHVAQLDGLRAVAVIMVVWSHTVREGLGNYGVKIFFVLSGFLITGILLRQRERADSLGDKLRTFYLRRALRIFPVYYALLAAMWIANVPDARHDVWWHALYLSNWMIALRSAWPTAAGHLWSLSVEEQFYLVWPLVILVTPRQSLGRVLWGVVAVGVLSRVVLPLLTSSTITLGTPTVVSLDALALGGILAWRRHRDAMPLKLGWAVITGLALIGLSTWLMHAGRGFKAIQLLDPIGIELVAIWAVDGCVRGFGGALGHVLSWGPLRAIGTVSYGVYLFHVWIVWGLLAHGWEMGLALFGAVLALTLVVSTLSWHILERPLNRMKDRLAAYGRPLTPRV
jgi:peptidoglycan/LPS O-acetylase OafA/YrhL